MSLILLYKYTDSRNFWYRYRSRKFYSSIKIEKAILEAGYNVGQHTHFLNRAGTAHFPCPTRVLRRQLFNSLDKFPPLP